MKDGSPVAFRRSGIAFVIPLVDSRSRVNGLFFQRFAKVSRGEFQRATLQIPQGDDRIDLRGARRWNPAGQKRSTKERH